MRAPNKFASRLVEEMIKFTFKRNKCKRGNERIYIATKLPSLEVKVCGEPVDKTERINFGVSREERFSFPSLEMGHFLFIYLVLQSAGSAVHG